jgi:hypothetical protein
MDREAVVRLNWNDDETIAAIPDLLMHAQKIEITLPADYNHALFRALHPHAPASEPEELDIHAGPELLADIASVRGLEKLTALAQPLTAAHASLRLLSPPMLVIEPPPLDQA